MHCWETARRAWLAGSRNSMDFSALTEKNAYGMLVALTDYKINAKPFQES